MTETASSAQRAAAAAAPDARRLNPLAELTRARLLEFWREPGAIFWTFAFPVLLAVALGIAFRTRPPEKLRVAVEAPAGADVQWIAELAAKSPDLDPRVMDPDRAARALRIGEVDLVVAAPQGRGGTLAYRYDSTRPQSQTARLAVDDALQRGLGRGDVARIEEVKVTEAGSRYIDFLLPGLIGLNLMGSSMWGLGYAVVSMRSRRLLKRFAATPMRRSHYLLSFMLSRLVFLVMEVAALLLFGWLVFGVTIQGSVLNVSVLSLLGAVSFAGLALLIAARPESVEVASGWMNFAMLPMWMLSGSFFSYARFPEFLHPAIQALPLTALNDALRAVMNEGASLASTWPQIGVLSAWGVLSFAVALRFFKWR